MGWGAVVVGVEAVVGWGAAVVRLEVVDVDETSS